VRRVKRRKFLILAGSATAGLATARWWFPRSLRPGEPVPLSLEATSLVNRCFADVDRTLLWDSHAHLVGIQECGNGCWISPKMRNHFHPVLRLQHDCLMAASGLTGFDGADEIYVERLLELQRRFNPAGKIVLLAFDLAVGENGEEARHRSMLHVPDEYVLSLAERYEEIEACVSIHPYRKDAAERLDRAAEAGAVAVKWLPNATDLDPASPLCDPFYRRMAALGIPLICHTGKEMTIHSEHQQFGNPLRLRRGLDHGVRIVAAHCASLGKSRDLDRNDGKRIPSFELFLRLMGEKQYEGKLFGDISAMTLISNAGRPLREILAAEEIHHRLVNGSDYPIPAIGPITSTWLLQRYGYITEVERRFCNEIFENNPLLFDFVLKRCIKVSRNGRTYRFPASVFESAHLFKRG